MALPDDWWENEPTWGTADKVKEEEVFRTHHKLGLTAETIKDPEVRKRYEAWLKNQA